MNVAIVSNDVLSLKNFRLGLILLLLRRGYAVTLVSPAMSGDQRLFFIEIGCELEEVELTRSYGSLIDGVASLLSLRRVLRRLAVDVVIAYFIKPIVWTDFALVGMSNVRRCYLIEGLGSQFSKYRTHVSGIKGLVQLGFRGLLRTVVRRSYITVVLNSDDKQYLVGDSPVLDEKILVRGAIGVDLQYWTPVPLPRRPIRFLMACRLVREKGVDVYARACLLLKQRHPLISTRLIGALDDSPDAMTSMEMKRWVDAGAFEWDGARDMRACLAESHVFVLPSHYREGSPRSIQEALAMARPVITTNNVGCRDLIDDGINGLLVPVQDPMALAAAMERCVLEPDEWLIDLGRAGRTYAEEFLDENRFNERIALDFGL